MRFFILQLFLRYNTYMNNTIDYYNKNAEKFITGTIDANMSAIQEDFLTYIPAGGSILDFGCGSGRDSKAFLDRGYQVLSVDGSIKMCIAAQQLTGQKVIHSMFNEFTSDLRFDGIWACASLLHLPKKELKPVIDMLSTLLKDGGCLYLSFKYGDFEGERNGRYFTDLTETSLDELTQSNPLLKKVKYTITGDVRVNRENEKWLNAFFTGRAG